MFYYNTILVKLKHKFTDSYTMSLDYIDILFAFISCKHVYMN